MKPVGNGRQATQADQLWRVSSYRESRAVVDPEEKRTAKCEVLLLVVSPSRYSA